MPKLCSLHQLRQMTTKPVALLTADLAYIVIKKRDDFFVFANSCPHLNKKLTTKNLTILDAGQDFIHCTRHNALFTLDEGLCIKGPCNGQRLTKIAHTVRGDGIYVTKTLS